MMLNAYRMATALGWPLIRLYLARRKSRGKEDPVRFGERLGQPSLPRPSGRLVWIHAASVGESLSLLPLISRLLSDQPGLNILMTTGTVTSAKLMAERLPEGAFHQYIPVDRLAFVRRFFDHWKPELVLWAESEFWPNLVSEPPARNIPLILINGRVSPRSFAGWQRYKGLIRKLLSGFTLALGQTEDDAERLRSLGAPRADCVGNLKFAAPPLPVDQSELARLKEISQGRPLWFASSTHDGEEAIAGRIHRALKPNHPGLLTVIAPRHPERGPEIAALLRESGLIVSVRSQGEEPTHDTDIYIADTMGELGLFYRLCEVVFIGKSISRHGGQNPLEAAQLDCAIVQGPYTENFIEISQKLADLKASAVVADEAALTTTVSQLLGDAGERQRLSDAAKAMASAEAGVLDRLIDTLRPYVSPPNSAPNAGASDAST